MSLLGSVWKGFTSLFSSGSKGIVEQVADTVDRFDPGPVTQNKMDIDTLKAGDDSQNSARMMQMPTHDDWFNRFVDGFNRLPRPALATWACGILFGWWEPPTYLESMSPLTANIVWSIVTFYFGARVIFKDVPAAFAAFVKMVKGNK